MSWTSGPLDDVAHHAGSLPVALTRTERFRDDLLPYLALPVAPVAILIPGPRLVLEGELEEQAVNLGRAVSSQVLQPKAAKAAGCGIRPGP